MTCHITSLLIPKGEFAFSKLTTREIYLLLTLQGKEITIYLNLVSATLCGTVGSRQTPAAGWVYKEAQVVSTFEPPFPRPDVVFYDFVVEQMVSQHLINSERRLLYLKTIKVIAMSSYDFCASSIQLPS